MASAYLHRRSHATVAPLPTASPYHCIATSVHIRTIAIPLQTVSPRHRIPIEVLICTAAAANALGSLVYMLTDCTLLPLHLTAKGSEEVAWIKKLGNK